MKIVSTFALALALAAGTAAAPALAKKSDAAAATGGKYSPAVQKAYNDAKKALDSGDIAGATAQYQALKGQVQTDDDKNVVGYLGIGIGQKTNDNKVLSEGIDMVLAGGKAPVDQQAKLRLVQGQLAYQAGDYQKAQTLLVQAQQAGATDENLVPLIVDTQAKNGQRLAALQTLNQAIAKRQAAGQTTPSEWYGRGLDIAYADKPANPDHAQVNAEATKLATSWLAAYPSKKNWRVALINYSVAYKIDQDQRADEWRLLRAAGAMAGESDYVEYADTVYTRNPGEAKAVMDEGVAAGMLNISGNRNASEIYNAVKNKVAGDRAALASSEKAANNAATGKIALSVGDGYAGYGDYAKAIPMYKLALSKGGVDAATVNRRLGIAYFKSGQKDAAKQAFGAVTGASQPLAQYWLTFIDHPATA